MASGLIFNGAVATLRIILTLRHPNGAEVGAPESLFAAAHGDEADRRDDLDGHLNGIVHKAFGSADVQSEPLSFIKVSVDEPKDFRGRSVNALVGVKTEKSVELDPTSFLDGVRTSKEQLEEPIRSYVDAFMNRDGRGPTRVAVADSRAELEAGALEAQTPPAKSSPDSAKDQAIVLASGVALAVAVGLATALAIGADPWPPW